LTSLNPTYLGARNSLQEREAFAVSLQALHPMANPAGMHSLHWNWAQGKWPIRKRRKLHHSLTNACFVALARAVVWEVAAESCMVANSKTIFQVKLPPQQQQFMLTC